MDRAKTLEELNRMIEELSLVIQAPGNDIDFGDLLASGSILADAELLLANRKAEVLSDLLELKPTMSANEQKVRVEAICAEEARAVRRIEQINRALGIVLANRNY